MKNKTLYLLTALIVFCSSSSYLYAGKTDKGIIRKVVVRTIDYDKGSFVIADNNNDQKEFVITVKSKIYLRRGLLKSRKNIKKMEEGDEVSVHFIKDDGNILTARKIYIYRKRHFLLYPLDVLWVGIKSIAILAGHAH